MKTNLHEQKKLLISLSDILGQLSRFVIQQSPYHSAEHVDSALGKLYASAVYGTEESVDMADWTSFGNDEIVLRYFSSYNEIVNWLNFVLRNTPETIAWNTPRNNHDSKMVFSSRYDSPDPDDDFIDIDALFRNTALAVWRDAERDHEFDQAFHSKWNSTRSKCKRAFGEFKTRLRTYRRRLSEKFFNEKILPGQIMTHSEQLNKWANGLSVHNGKTPSEGECCPDFSCCTTTSMPLAHRKDYVENFKKREKEYNSQSLFRSVKEAWQGKD